MKKFLKYLGSVTIVLTILISGMYIGMKVEKYNEEQRNGSFSNSTKIALVNLDEGVEYQGVQRNFTNELLGSKTEQYVLTGLEDARSGLSDGRYAAYVIIPSDLSKNIISINNTPAKSLLKYEVSGNLSSEAVDKAWQNIMKLKEDMNDDIGYMYISSILGEFHEGQLNALKVLSNDDKDKEVIMAISNLDLIAVLDLKEVERLQNDIEDLDINPDIEENKKIIASIDAAYKKYLTETIEELNTLKSDSADVNAGIEVVKSAGEKIKNLENADGSDNYTTENTVAFLSDYNAGVALSLSSLLNEINEKAQLQDTKVSSYKDKQLHDFDDLMDAFQKSHESSQQEQYGNISNQIDTITADFIKHKKFSWTDFSSLKTVIENKKDREILDNAIQYLDKSIINKFMEYDFSLADTNFETIIADLDASVKNDKKLQQSLLIIAKASGRKEEEIQNYTIRDYVDNNDITLMDFHDIDSTQRTDQLLIDAEEALKVDGMSLLNNITKALNDPVKEFIENIVSTDIRQDSNDSIQAYKEQVEGYTGVDLEELKTETNKITHIETDAVITNIKNDLKPLVKEQTENKEQLLDVIENHKILNSTFHDQFLQYDPLRPVDTNEIEDYVKDFEYNNESTKNKIESKNREYTTFVSDSYSNANEHINSMKEDIHKYQTESNEKVTSTLENAKKTKNNTSSLNNALMNSYINKLPYTRNGTIANTVVYDFITAPTDLEGEKISANTHTYDSYIFKGLLIGVTGLIACWAILSLISRGILKMYHK